MGQGRDHNLDARGGRADGVRFHPGSEDRPVGVAARPHNPEKSEQIARRLVSLTLDLAIQIAIANIVWHSIVMKLKLDKLGRVVLPKPLRARYGLRPGTELEVSEGAQEFALRPARSGPSLVEIDGILVHQGVPQGELDIVKAIREDREERLQHLSGME